MGGLENEVTQNINDILMKITGPLLAQTIVMNEMRKEFVKFIEDTGLSH